MSESKQSLTKSFLKKNWYVHFCCFSYGGVVQVKSFYQDQKNLEKIYPLNQEILLIFCSIPSKKIGNPTSPLLTSASAQTISTPTKLFYCRAYTENEEAWLVQMELAALLFQIQCLPFIFIAVLLINLQYKLYYGCQSRYLLYRQGKIKSFASVAAENLF